MSYKTAPLPGGRSGGDDWKASHGVGITSIDDQHEELSAALRAFFDDVAMGHATEQAAERFDAIITAVREHFAHEERLMANIGVPGLDRHKQQHERLLLSIEGYRKSLPSRLAEGSLDEVRDYLTHWLVQHISVEDRLIREHLLSGSEAVEHHSARHPSTALPGMGEQDRPVVLIVDDVPTNIQILADILKDGHRILVATSGREALRVASTGEPDLILLDVMMPDVDGFTVCAKLKSDPLLRDTPVVFITAMGEVEDETKGLEVGAVDYLTKPVSPPIVRARVRNHLELKRQRDLLRRIALVDGLTGIANRRHLDDAFDREWRRAQRQDAPLSLVMGDVDFFKGYNDLYGHQAGDACLRSVAQAIAAQMMRPTDLAARFGGEEFACLLPDTTLEGAVDVAERIRKAVEDLGIPHQASGVGLVVTISLGVATVVPGTAGAEIDPRDLLAAADHSLYEAKKGGRNRVRAETLSVSLAAPAAGPERIDTP